MPDWLYYSFLTVLVQGMCVTAYYLAKDFYDEWALKKAREANPQFDEFVGLFEDLEDLAGGGPISPEDGIIPVRAFLAIPGKGEITTGNSAVFCTRERAVEHLDPGDIIIPIMSFPPDARERKLIRTPKFQKENLIAVLSTMGAEDESSSE